MLPLMVELESRHIKTHGLKQRENCRYSNGKCPNKRAIKKNGALHSLCQEHRRRACENQRRLDRQKRALRISERRQRHSELTAEVIELPVELSSPKSDCSSSVTTNDQYVWDQASENCTENLDGPIVRPSLALQELKPAEIDFFVSCFVDPSIESCHEIM